MGWFFFSNGVKEKKWRELLFPRLPFISLNRLQINTSENKFLGHHKCMCFASNHQSALEHQQLGCQTRHDFGKFQEFHDWLWSSAAWTHIEVKIRLIILNYKVLILATAKKSVNCTIHSVESITWNWIWYSNTVFTSFLLFKNI